MHDRVDLGEMPRIASVSGTMECMASMRKIPPNAALFLCREIDFEIMEEVSNKLPPGNKQWQELQHRRHPTRFILNTLRMELSFFGNGAEQHSMPESEVNNLPLIMSTNGWQES